MVLGKPWTIQLFFSSSHLLISLTTRSVTTWSSTTDFEMSKQKRNQKLTEFVTLVGGRYHFADFGLLDHFLSQDVTEVDTDPSCKLVSDKLRNISSEGAWWSHDEDSLNCE